MSFSSLRHRLAPHALILSLLTSTAVLSIGISLLYSHITALRLVKDIGLPAAVELPRLEQHLTVLHDQLEASEVQEAMQGGAMEEALHVYVLPEELPLNRTLALFDVVRDEWARAKILKSLSGIEVGKEETVKFQEEEVRAQTLTFDAVMTKEGADKMLLLLRLSGLLTISDALTTQEIFDLIDRTEEENAAALPIVENFFEKDLLEYSLDPRPVVERVSRSLTSNTFQKTFKDILEKSLLAKARYLFGSDLGKSLEAHKLWPLPLMTVEKVSKQILPSGEVNLSLVVRVYARNE